GVNQSALGLVQSKEYFALPKKRRLRRIQILRAFLIVLEQPAAEGDDFAHVVANWEHETAAKTIVSALLLRWLLRFGLVLCFDQAAGQQLGFPIPVALRPTPECVPFIGRVSELPIFGDLHWNAALLQILPGRGGELFLQKIFLKPFGRFCVQTKKRAARFMLSIFVGAGAPLFHD